MTRSALSLLCLLLLGGSGKTSPVRIPTEPGAPSLCLPALPSADRLRAKHRRALARAVDALAHPTPAVEDPDAPAAPTAGTWLEGLPDHPDVVATRAVVAVTEGRLEDAEALLGPLLQAFPDDPCLLTSAAINDFLAAEDVRGAERARAAFQRAPTDADAAMIHAFFLSETDHAAAEGVLAQVLVDHPGHPGASFYLGLVVLSRGGVELAVPLLEAARDGGIDVERPLMQAYYYAGRHQDYVRAAARAGLPIADRDAVLAADDPMAALRAGLGAGPGEALVATIRTSLGPLRCTLFVESAPVTVSSFVGLARGTQPWIDPRTGEPGAGPLYANIPFHRVIPGFMIQGGDPTGSGTGGPGYVFPDELDPALSFDKAGVLAMANAGPHSNGSQFFITAGPARHLDGRHTIFGQCDAAASAVVDTITSVPRDATDRPTTAVTIEGVAIEAEPATP